MDEAALSVKEMAATLAHEVKNPLSLVRANIDFLEAEDETGRHEKNYCVIKRELTKIDGLVLDIIRLSLAPAEQTAVELRALIESLVKPFADTYSPGISFKLDMPRKKVFTKGNSQRLSLLFNNILKNAAEAVVSAKPEAGGLIEISIRIDSSDKKACVTVCDNGVGLSGNPNAMKLGYTTKEKGTGFGLYASKLIAAQHGGVISLSGKTGEGCTAAVMLPIM